MTGTVSLAARLLGFIPPRFQADVYDKLARLRLPLRRALHRRRRVALHNTELRLFGEPGAHTFFGYYDLCPFDAEEQQLLALRVRGDGPADILCFDLNAGTEQPRVIGTTHAWCWQQGSRLRWWDEGRRVIHNHLRDGRLVSVIRRVDDGGVDQMIPHPLYDISPDRRFGLTLNFARLQRLRPGYGYPLADSSAGESAPADDGLILVDLATGVSRLLLSLEQAASLGEPADSAGAQHYMNHISWAPDGRHALVFHLWDDSHRRRARALVVNTETGAVTLPAGEAKVSHYCWLDADTLLLTATPPGHSFGYHLYRLNHGWGGQILPAALGRDGHPTPRPGHQSQLITDTYPDTFWERQLLQVDSLSGKVTPLASLYSPPQFAGERRCDLHPRWSPSGRLICFDSAHSGWRNLCIVTANDL